MGILARMGTLIRAKMNEILDRAEDPRETLEYSYTKQRQMLTDKIEAFRTRKETIKAQYSAAEAQVKIGEAATGISEEMADVGLAIERAEEKTERLRARAAAIDELVAEGTLEEFAGRTDVVERELAQLETSQNVDKELAALKQDLQRSRGQLPEGSQGKEEMR